MWGSSSETRFRPRPRRLRTGQGRCPRGGLPLRAVEQCGRDPSRHVAPVRLWAAVIPARWSTLAIMFAVVVFPLVALTITDPRESWRASSETAFGSRRSSSFPGRLVPPPRRLSLDRRPAAFASAILLRNPIKRSGSGGGSDHAHRVGYESHGGG